MSFEVFALAAPNPTTTPRTPVFDGGSTRNNFISKTHTPYDDSPFSELDVDSGDGFSFTSSFDEEAMGNKSKDSFANNIDQFISKEFPLEHRTIATSNVISLDEAIISTICSFLDQYDTCNLMLVNSHFLPSARIRLYKRVIVVENKTELARAKRETSKACTVITKHKLLDCFDTIRLGDPALSFYMEEVICFAKYDWSIRADYSINDSWYLSAPLLTNLKTLMWPSMPIAKYQVLTNATRCQVRTLCIGFAELKQENLKSYDNLMLQFPNVVNLIINIDENCDASDLLLHTNLLILGDVLQNVETLTISGGRYSTISDRKFFKNDKPVARQVVSSNPVSTMTNHSVSMPSTPTKSKRTSFRDKLKNNFVSPVSSPCSKTFPSPPSFLPLPTHVIQKSAMVRPNLNQPKVPFYSSIWGNILIQFGQYKKLHLNTLTLDTVELRDFDFEVIIKSIDIYSLKRLELSNVITYYDEMEDRLEPETPILTKLGPYLQSLTSLAIDYRFECRSCHRDCYQYCENEFFKFLNQINSLEKLHLAVYGKITLEPIMLMKHQFTLKKLSIVKPPSLPSLIHLLRENQKLLTEFWQNERQITQYKRSLSALEKLLEIGTLHTYLGDDCVSPNLSRLDSYNYSRNRIIGVYKYLLLSIFGNDLDRFDSFLPRLGEISFYGVKFKS